MPHSTLFALSAAVLIGLGVAVVARLSGLFNRSTDVVVKKADPIVLVAARNLFANDMISTTGVRVRNLKADEVAAYKQHPDNYLPAVPTAANMRVAKVNIEADTPITRDLLKEMTKPTPLNERLTPNMRAINLSLTKDHSAGGMVQVGEWVEVYLTSVIDGVDGNHGARTATIVPSARLIAKRDTLWQLFTPLPKDKPIEYTLEVNSYRTALIEFCRNKGVLSFSPLPAVDQKKLEAKRQEALSAGKKPESGIGNPVAASIESAPVDGDDKDMELAESADKGELVITDADLVLLFGIKRPSPPPPPATVNIERISGIRRVDSAVFTLDGQRYTPGVGQNNDQYGDHRRTPFTVPSIGEIRVGNRARGHDWNGTYRGNSNSAGDPSNYRFTAPDCPTCGKKKFQ